ncbi:MAG: helix-turn-helix domain-containing protein [Janthinobacterium lividum]
MSTLQIFYKKFGQIFFMLGERLKQAIRGAGVSYAKAAIEIGVSEGNLYNLFKKESFDVAYLLKAAQFLKLPLSYFLEDADPGHTSIQADDSNQASSGDSQNVKGDRNQSVTGNHNKITNNIKLDDCKRDLASAEKENAHLREQLASRDAVIAAKDETITLLRGSYRNPN